VRLSSKLTLIFAALLLGGLLIVSPLIHWMTEWWWYGSLGQQGVLVTLTVGQSLAWGISALVFFLFSWGNYRLALNLTRYSVFRVKSGFAPEGMPVQSMISFLAVGLAVFWALSGASGFLNAWEIILRFYYASPFNLTDPIFGQDVGFYTFTLPFYHLVRNWLLYLVVIGLLTTVPVYIFKGTLDLGRGWQNLIIGRPKAHLTILTMALLVLIAWSYWLARFELLYSPEGAVFGAGYADAHSGLWVLAALSLLGAVAVGLLGWSLRRNGVVFALGVIGSYGAIAFLLPIIPALEQQLIVSPNELTKETPYIEYNLEFTRQAYGLNSIERQVYPVEPTLTQAKLQDNRATIDNIRLWDYRPLLSTYREVQGLRLYYSFQDVDLDRYTLEQNYRQVMLSARELEYDRVPARAKTWVNQRLKYTHGYGLTMSPVNRITPQGQPEFFIQDIPPVINTDLVLKQPRIYYGEATDSLIFTGMGTDEFDYPIGQENAANRYSGLGGIPIPSLWQRLLYALDYTDLRILISNYFTPQARIHYHRQVRDRVQRLAPFLRLDEDPYLVLTNGRLQWFLDAYTISDRFPYAEPISPDFNYIRNSVKVVVDAYDGTVQLLVVDDQDPILQTYQKIYPSLFTNSSAPIDPAVRAHFRYPEDLFRIQSQMYLSYHMTNAEVFYNQEDLWRVPIQKYEDTEEVMEPYYVVMKLPEMTEPEFLLIMPFTPVNRDNMVAWLAARCDGDRYGEAILYEFPKQELIYGPRQIEARIDQNPEISQQLTLWSQEGSRVIRGDLLVIPIENSLLYVEPIYLRGEQSQLPELKRVIVAYDQDIFMTATLEESLELMFGVASPAAAAAAEPKPSPSPSLSPLAQEALKIYEASQEALQNGRWEDYGALNQQLADLLRQLNAEVVPME